MPYKNAEMFEEMCFGFVFLKLVLLCNYSNVLSIYLRGNNIGSNLV